MNVSASWNQELPVFRFRLNEVSEDDEEEDDDAADLFLILPFVVFSD